jgi:hypothetical protein
MLNVNICVEDVGVNAQTNVNHIHVAACMSLIISMEERTWFKIICKIEVPAALILRIQVILSSSVTDT